MPELICGRIEAGENYNLTRDDIPKEYDNMYVYGIGMEDNPVIEELLKDREHDTCLKKRMVLVFLDKARELMC